MTEEDYRKKQRILIIAFTIGAVTVLLIFVYSISRTFSELQVSNPVDGVLDESRQGDEFNQLQQSLDVIQEDIERFDQEEESSDSQTESGSGDLNTSDSPQNTQSDRPEQGQDNINQFIQ